MRIAITADPYIPVPPSLYGGVERIVALLARSLIRRGHQVTLVAHPDSRIDGADLVPYGSPPHFGVVNRARELLQVQGALCRRLRSIDIVHSFGRLAGLLPILPLRSFPKVQSYQRPISWPGIRRAARLAGESIVFTACSSSMYRRRTNGRLPGVWQTIYNGVEMERYRFVERVAADAPLVFLGQLEPMKGPDIAIEIARAAGRRLVIAGTRLPGPAGDRYFSTAIAPALGADVEYVGGVDDRQKNQLLGRAAALVFPTLYDEAFGIVMAEAMACGTPVIGFDNGAVAEVVCHRRTGFVCSGARQAVEAVRQLDAIDRRVVRSECERRFSADVIAADYEVLYRTLVDARRPASLPQ